MRFSKESKFQSEVISEIKNRLGGAIVLKNDPQYLQGIPDLSIFWKNKWAMLECKKSADEPYRPNQPYYIDLANSMSYCRTIYPENKEEVLNDMERAFRA